MTQPTKLNFKIYQGSTFTEVLRWESATKIYSPIVNITKTAPITIQLGSHSLVPGWRAKVVGVGGMKEINTDSWVVATSIVGNTVTFNHINALNYTTYTGGGVLEYNQPVDLGGYTARMQIRPKLDSAEVIHEITTENGGIVLNNTEKTIVLNISANTTAAFNFSSAVYSLEMVSGSIVTQLLSGSVALLKEVTR